MKAFLTGLIDDISLEAIEKFANVLMVKYEIALKQTETQLMSLQLRFYKTN